MSHRKNPIPTPVRRGDWEEDFTLTPTLSRQGRGGWIPAYAGMTGRDAIALLLTALLLTTLHARTYNRDNARNHA